MNFSEALEAMKTGKKIRRISYIPECHYFLKNKIVLSLGHEECDYGALLNSQDVLAEDWEIVE